ncbi:hypothetical protein [Chondromyces crocatus]|uniref:Uncharacterized protein n=1 Tax=Chondromyces crocatus TaxID=52 RepID=A0A0K1EFQ0_CHOCO|nr:hypothetical protein [Chondromyces crocatus]AKT39413.1 uncharacterized protein CMC5_035600 [Chondromyces crocatus]
MPERPLQHRDPDKKDDETLRKEARAHFASEPALQLVAELIARLRELDLPWWSPVRLRDRWGAVERMRWLRERADLRQRVTSSLTGLAPKAARKKAPDFQGALLDSVIDDGDVTVRVFEEQFQPFEIAVYGPAGAYWNFFRESLPWDQETQVHHDLMTWLFKSLLSDRSPFDGIGRTPILTPWDVRTAIDGRVWHTRIPLEVRVAIDEARLQQERDRPGVPFHAEGDLSIAVPEIIATSIPLRDLVPVLNVAQKSMRFEASPRAASKIEGSGADSSMRTPEIGATAAPALPGGNVAAVPGSGAQAPATTPPPPLSSGPPTLTGGPPLLGLSPFQEGGRTGGPPVSPPAPVSGGAEPAPASKPQSVTSMDLGPIQDPRSGEPSSKPPATVPPSLITATTIPAPPLIQMGLQAASGGPPVPAPVVAPPSGGPASAPGFVEAASAPGAPGPGAAPVSAPPLVEPGRVAAPPPSEPKPVIVSSARGSSPERSSGGRPGGGSSGLLALLNSIDAEDEMEMTNPYSMPTPEEIAAESARLPPQPDDGSGKRRKA